MALQSIATGGSRGPQMMGSPIFPGAPSILNRGAWEASERRKANAKYVGDKAVGGKTYVGSSGAVGAYSGMNTGGSEARIGNVGGVMAPPSPNALEANGRPGMGNLDSFYAWQQAGMPFFAPQSNAGASGSVPRGLPPSDPFASTGTSWLDNPFDDPFSPYFVPQRLAGGPITASDPRIYDDQPITGSFDQGLGGNPTLGPSKGYTYGGPPPASSLFDPAELGLHAPRMERGGRMNGMHPYMVGEAGPEVAVYEDGTAEVVGKHGPEVRTFPKDGEIIPNKELYSADDVARRRRRALKNGDFHSYLNTMLLANVHIPAHG